MGCGASSEATGVATEAKQVAESPKGTDQKRAVEAPAPPAPSAPPEQAKEETAPVTKPELPSADLVIAGKAEVPSAPPPHEIPKVSEAGRKSRPTRPPEPDPTLHVKFWKGDPLQDTLVFPELSDSEHGMPMLKSKSDLAICIAGEGVKGTTLSLGWVRALYDMNLVQRARYLASSSGASWFNAVFSYQKSTSPESFLGQYLAPEQCTLESLKSLDHDSYAHVVSDGESIRSFLTGSIGTGSWAEVIGEAIMEPYGLSDKRSSCTAARTKGMVHTDTTSQACGNGIKMLTAMTRPNMPFPILTAAVVIDDAPMSYPIEFTPLYLGVPAMLSETNPPLGGYVEPFGLNSSIIKAVDDCKAEVITKGVVSLADWAAVSSARATRMGFEYWSPNHVEAGSKMVDLSDSTGVDPCAILPPLRRGVSKIIACTPLECDLQDKEEFTKSQGGLARLFGVEDTRFKVFEEGFDAVFEGLQATAGAGSTPHYKGSFVSVENVSLGIKAGITVEILWVGLGKSTAWEGQLPEETQAKLHANFPCVPNDVAVYDAELVGLLSQLSNWSMLQLKETLEEFVGPV